MVGSNLTDKQLQEIVDKTILYADKDGDGKISFDEFCKVSPTWRVYPVLYTPGLCCKRYRSSVTEHINHAAIHFIWRSRK